MCILRQFGNCNCIFGNDTHGPLVNSGKILMSYQLPLLQACIYMLSRLWADPLMVLIFMAALGAEAG